MTTTAIILNESADKLNSFAGQQMTIFKLSEFGFPQLMLCKVLKAEVKPYAQYPAVLYIDLILKGKRKPLRFRIMDYSDILVYEGHVNLNAEMYVSSTTNGPVTIKRSDTGFSKGYITRALESTTQEPIIKILK